MRTLQLYKQRPEIACTVHEGPGGHSGPTTGTGILVAISTCGLGRNESDCRASKQNNFGCRLNFRLRWREALTPFVWAGSSFKSFGTLEEVNQIRQNASQRPNPISGKVGHSLLSNVWGCNILIDFLLLGYFCQSIYQLDVAICSIN